MKIRLYILTFLLALVSTGWAQINNGGGGSGSGTVSANNTAAGAAANYALAGGSTTVGPTTLNYVAPTLTVSIAGGGNGVLALAGNTSGTATITAPAVAGTSTNPTTFSNVITAPPGAFANPTYASSVNPNSGYSFASGSPVLVNAGAAVFGYGNGFAADQVIATPLAFCTGSGSCDTGISRTAVASLAFGNGTASDSSATLIFKAQASNTNCSAVGTAASPSVASCGSAMAGSFSCATNASGATCVVNTTTVTANSEIFITQRSDTTTGTRLGVTCNTTLSTVLPEITAVTAGTSFTINLGTITTNPECFSYFLVN